MKLGGKSRLAKFWKIKKFKLPISDGHILAPVGGWISSLGVRFLHRIDGGWRKLAQRFASASPDTRIQRENSHTHGYTDTRTERSFVPTRVRLRVSAAGATTTTTGPDRLSSVLSQFSIAYSKAWSEGGRVALRLTTFVPSFVLFLPLALASLSLSLSPSQKMHFCCVRISPPFSLHDPPTCLFLSFPASTSRERLRKKKELFLASSSLSSSRSHRAFSLSLSLSRRRTGCTFPCISLTHSRTTHLVEKLLSLFSSPKKEMNRNRHSSFILHTYKHPCELNKRRARISLHSTFSSLFKFMLRIESAILSFIGLSFSLSFAFHRLRTRRKTASISKRSREDWFNNYFLAIVLKYWVLSLSQKKVICSWIETQHPFFPTLRTYDDISNCKHTRLYHTNCNRTRSLAGKKLIGATDRLQTDSFDTRKKCKRVTAAACVKLLHRSTLKSRFKGYSIYTL